MEYIIDVFGGGLIVDGRGGVSAQHAKNSVGPGISFFFVVAWNKYIKKAM